MPNDNTTPMSAKEYDVKINQTIPYYSEFYRQTLDVIEQCDFNEIDWLDLGCGTGTLEEQAFQKFPAVRFVLVDPSEKMLEQAKFKLENRSVKFVCAMSDSVKYENCLDVVTAIQSHHYMREQERKKATECVYMQMGLYGIK